MPEPIPDEPSDDDLERYDCLGHRALQTMLDMLNDEREPHDTSYWLLQPVWLDMIDYMLNCMHDTPDQLVRDIMYVVKGRSEQNNDN